MIPDGKKIYGSFIGQPIFARKLFADLPLSVRKRVSSIQKREKINKGEIISKFGNFPENIYVLREGKAQMTLENALNRKRYARLIEKEEFIGLTQFFSNTPNAMSIITLSPCYFNAFRSQDFLDFLKDEPQICFRLLKEMSLDIQSGYRTFSSMSF
jgi:CRP-like cAMP-binding protein